MTVSSVFQIFYAAAVTDIALAVRLATFRSGGFLSFAQRYSVRRRRGERWDIARTTEILANGG
jgi:hypothetical protein